MDPFHKTVMMRVMVISIVNPQKFLIFVFKKKCIYIYITILCIILTLPLHQITKTNFYANVRVFLMQRL